MTDLNKSILVALFDLAQSDTPASVQALAEHLGLTRKQVAGCVSELAGRGLVRPETIRLTFVGLTHASALRSRRAQAVAA